MTNAGRGVFFKGSEKKIMMNHVLENQFLINFTVCLKFKSIISIVWFESDSISIQIKTFQIILHELNLSSHVLKYKII